MHKKTNHKRLVFKGMFGRHERIRTSDPRHPMTVRYQAALHADAMQSVYLFPMAMQDR
ncbi:protein of unknown function [Serratia sp. Tan611]|nr:protein of unknown function [Serratia sp. Tan611]